MLCRSRPKVKGCGRVDRYCARQMQGHEEYGEEMLPSQKDYCWSKGGGECAPECPHWWPTRRKPTTAGQEQQERNISRVSTHSLAKIHGRYDKVAQALRQNQCSMANAFHLSGCPRNTLRDFVTIELKIVISWEHDLEAVSRKRLRQQLPVMANMWREGQLLHLKFDDRFYEWSCSSNKQMAPLGATKFEKVNEQQ